MRYMAPDALIDRRRQENPKTQVRLRTLVVLASACIWTRHALVCSKCAYWRRPAHHVCKQCGSGLHHLVDRDVLDMVHCSSLFTVPPSTLLTLPCIYSLLTSGWTRALEQLASLTHHVQLLGVCHMQHLHRRACKAHAPPAAKSVWVSRAHGCRADCRLP